MKLASARSLHTWDNKTCSVINKNWAIGCSKQPGGGLGCYGNQMMMGLKQD